MDRLFTTPVILLLTVAKMIKINVLMLQLILLNIALLVRAEAGETVMLIGNDILFVITGLPPTPL